MWISQMCDPASKIPQPLCTAMSAGPPFQPQHGGGPATETGYTWCTTRGCRGPWQDDICLAGHQGQGEQKGNTVYRLWKAELATWHQ